MGRKHSLASLRAQRIMLLGVLLVTVGVEAQAQSWTQYDQGTPPQLAAGVGSLGSYISADVGTVNLSNGALNLSLPLASSGGRGFSLPIALHYNSKVWSVAKDYDQNLRGEGQEGSKLCLMPRWVSRNRSTSTHMCTTIRYIMLILMAIAGNHQD